MTKTDVQQRAELVQAELQNLAGDLQKQAQVYAADLQKQARKQAKVLEKQARKQAASVEKQMVKSIKKSDDGTLLLAVLGALFAAFFLGWLVGRRRKTADAPPAVESAPEASTSAEAS